MRSRASSFPARKAHLSSRIEVCVLVVLGALIFSPAIRAPLFLDDFLQASMVEGTFPAHRGPFDLYDFVADDTRGPMLDRGVLPWWTDRGLTIRFFRPLASALLYVEHRLFDHAALPMHLVSFAWWLAAALVARAFFRRMLAPRPARIATFVFALAPCHALPIGWLANRETLLSLVFGGLGLLFYARWRDERRPLQAVAVFVSFLLAFFGGGEYAFTFGGYVLAFDLVRRGEPVARRTTGWLPFAAPALLYLGLRTWLRYGAAASGFYTDPIHDTAAFLANAPMRAASLLGAGWLTFDVVWWRAGAIVPTFLLLALAAAVLVAIPVVRVTFARLEPASRTFAAWMLYGSLLAIVPVLAAAPAPRLLGASMIGIASVVAIVVDLAWFPKSEDAARSPTAGPSSGPRTGWMSLAALGLAFAHFVHGPGTSWLKAEGHRVAALDLVHRVEFVRANVADTKRTPVAAFRALASVFFMPFALDPKSPPPRWFVLSQAGHALALRQGPRTLDLVVPPGGIYPEGERSLYRRSDLPLKKGDEFRTKGMRVTVLDAGTKDSMRLRFEFDRDPSKFVWISDTRTAIFLADLPKVGFGHPFDVRDAAPSPVR